MNIGDYLLKSNKITQKQREKAELEHEVSGNKFGKCCIDLGFITRTELNQALKAVKKYQEGENKDMARPTEIGESSKFTFDLKFLITMGAVIVSGCGIYFTMNSAIDELKSSNSPSRLEYDLIVGEISGIKNAGNLDIITYKLEEYDKTFEEIKELVNDLKPLKADLEYIKKEINNLKNADPIEIPEVNLSGLEGAIDNLTNKIESMENKINEYEDRLKKVEESGGGRF